MNADDFQSFPSLFIFDQLRVIDQIISIAGNECNPNEAILSILSESLQKASRGGRIEISNQLPNWIKRQQSILNFLPETERKIICLEIFLSKLENEKKLLDKEAILNQIAEVISNSKQNEYSLLIAKLPCWIQEYDSVFHLLRLEDRIRILCDKLSATKESNTKSIIQQIAESLSGIPENKCQQLLVDLPNWAREEEEIIPFLLPEERTEILIGKLTNDKGLFDKKTILNQIAAIISNSKQIISDSEQNEYLLLITKLPRWVQECDSVFYLLRLEDRIRILCDKLPATKESNTKSIIQQIAKSLSGISEDKCQQLLVKLPNWAREEEEIIPFLLPEERIGILIGKLTDHDIVNYESTVGEIVEILSKLNTRDREPLLQNLPKWLRFHDLIFNFLPFEKRLNHLLTNFPLADNKGESVKLDDLEKFLTLKVSSKPEIKNFRKSQLQEWLATEYEKWLIEQQRQEREKVAIQQFIDLKGKYLAKSHREHSPLSPLYPILIKIDSGEFLGGEEIQFLMQNNLFGTLAICSEMKYKITHDSWELVKASGYWRDDGQPDKSIQTTEDLLSKHNLLDPRVKAATLTTRGGAFRDLHRLGDAEQCANLAIQVNERNYYPYNLLGAIYFERGDAERGEACFLKALELGAPSRSQEAQMKSALKNAGQVEKRSVAQYLLQRDPMKYQWANYYL
jgi:hypothetical protein